MADPVEAFRFVFTPSCVMPEPDIRAFAGIAASSARLDAYARGLIEDTVGPVTDRVREAGRMRDDQVPRRTTTASDPPSTYCRSAAGRPLTLPGDRSRRFPVL